MRAALRTALFCSISVASTTPFHRPLLRNLSLSLPLLPLSPHPCRLSETAGPPPPMANTPPSDASAAASSKDVDYAGGEESLLYISSSMDRQFEDFRAQMEESGNIRERIRAVATEMEAALRVMHSYLLLVHQSLPVPEVLKKAKSQIGVLKDLYGRLAEILRGCPGQYYRYHGDWRSETQTAVSLLTFSRWLESGCLMTHSEVENELGCEELPFPFNALRYISVILLFSCFL